MPNKLDKQLLKNKIRKNLEEYANNATLSNGQKIKSKKQALAISYSEAKDPKYKKGKK